MSHPHAPSGTRSIDDIDLALLHALQADARAPISILSEAAGVSRATAYARLARLREEGVIEALTVTVNPKRVGLGVTAVILIRSTPDHWKTWASLVPIVEAMEEVEYAADIAGEVDLLMLVRLRDIDHLQRFVTDELRRRVPGVGSVRTLLVLNQTPERSLVLPRP
ncbi:MAG TPA: Lrp/AsnC family transcriptional regulator [Candidatus Nanopelagicales bacterium]|mgnify:CR=1 FL=1|nr:Lrp/AsnC family transcriptional regulator [Candidatus Nanopelagicales bacterium]